MTRLRINVKVSCNVGDDKKLHQDSCMMFEEDGCDVVVVVEEKGRVGSGEFCM